MGWKMLAVIGVAMLVSACDANIKHAKKCEPKDGLVETCHHVLKYDTHAVTAPNQ